MSIEGRRVRRQWTRSTGHRRPHPQPFDRSGCCRACCCCCGDCCCCPHPAPNPATRAPKLGANGERSEFCRCRPANAVDKRGTSDGLDASGEGIDAWACSAGRVDEGACWTGRPRPGGETCGYCAPLRPGGRDSAAAMGANAPSLGDMGPPGGGGSAFANSPAGGKPAVGQPAACAAELPCVRFGIDSNECGVTGCACGAVEPGGAKALLPTSGEPLRPPVVGAQMLEMAGCDEVRASGAVNEPGALATGPVTGGGGGPPARRS